jgi:hypothetical protein
MPSATVTPIDANAPIPDLSAIELSVIICLARQPGIAVASVAAEIGRWFKTEVIDSDLSTALRRLIRREWLTTDGIALHATDEAIRKAEFAAKGIVGLIYRDKYFFDVGKLLDVTLVREDRPDVS